MVEGNFKASRTASISILGAQGTVAKPAATLYKAMDGFVDTCRDHNQHN